jgi:Rab proteins geranylgeranyltransferase component A
MFSFILHLSTPCEDALSGKAYINSAIEALFNQRELSAESVEAQPNEEGESVAAQTTEEGDKKPTLLWSCTFVQELREVISYCILSHVAYCSIFAKTTHHFSFL